MNQAPFHSPEHCLTVAFAFAELRIEPKNATAAVIDSMRSKAGQLKDLRPPSGMSQHEWHAQAVMALMFAERTLSPHPMLWQAILAEYCHGVKGALAIQAVGEHLAPGLEGRARLLADMLIMRQFRGRPRLRDLADQFDVSMPTISRQGRQYQEPVRQLRDAAIQRLLAPMEEAGLVGMRLTA